MDLIERMKAGDTEAILNALGHKGAIVRVNGIIFSVKNSYASKEVIRSIKELTADQTCLFGSAGYSVSDFAYSALHLLGVREYQGERKEVLDLIESKFVF